MHRTALLAAAALVLAAPCARADFIYKFSTDTISGLTPGHGPFYAWLDVTDLQPIISSFPGSDDTGSVAVQYMTSSAAAFDAGRLDCDQAAFHDCAVQSSPDFVSLVTAGGDYQPTQGHGWLDVLFRPDAQIGNGHVVIADFQQTLQMDGTGEGVGDWSGTESDDGGPCHLACTFTGHWTLVRRTAGDDPSPVPEPATLALLAVGLVGIGLARRGSVRLA